MRKLFSIKDCRTLLPKTMHHLCCFRWCRHVISWMGCCLVGVCFPWFRASCLLFVGFVQLLITDSIELKNPPYRKMANFRKVLMQSWCSLVQHTFLTDLDWLYTSAPEMAWNMQMSTNDNSPINVLQSASLATNSHLFMLRFPYFLETLCLYFEKYGRTSVLTSDFHTNMVKYRQVGRSDDASNTHVHISK